MEETEKKYTALMKHEDTGAIFKPENKEVLDVIRNTVCKGATPSEFVMFLEMCKATGLNPFLNEIWFFKVNGRVAMMAGRDGFLKIANNNSNFDGIEGEVIYPNNDINQTPIGAWAKAYRKDRRIPVKITVSFKEYNRPNSDSWKRYPSAMILKVAESMALKRAFSVSGLVSAEEMGGKNIEEVSLAQNEISASDDTQKQKQDVYFKIVNTKNGNKVLRESLEKSGVAKARDLTLDKLKEILEETEKRNETEITEEAQRVYDENDSGYFFTPLKNGNIECDKVKSGVVEKIYTLSVIGNSVDCNCEGFQFKKKCKHAEKLTARLEYEKEFCENIMKEQGEDTPWQKIKPNMIMVLLQEKEEEKAMFQPIKAKDYKAVNFQDIINYLREQLKYDMSVAEIWQCSEIMFPTTDLKKASQKKLREIFETLIEKPESLLKGMLSERND